MRTCTKRIDSHVGPNSDSDRECRVSFLRTVRIGVRTHVAASFGAMPAPRRFPHGFFVHALRHSRIPAAFAAVLVLCVAGHAQEVRLSKERYLDKCKGAWAGQMVGVCFGAPYEFKFCGKPLLDPLQPWTPERVKGAIDQDDCYVEMTFLKAIEDHGLDVTYEQAGKAFAETEFELWHANKFGRENVRRGIMPPKSGNPEFNKHADDIDFQIEADLFGILCPGLPQECNRLCDIFGHVMNYGDGVYGGMFVAGMYVAA